ncbi:MAG TPA: SGNH/GDSL hydrolase family protein [Microthrixaceae bacterium]|nr:SGNH/GDSL hydrolase family protein [Propionibacteriaceae bacterium]HPF82278.1 SGNH/GDSL hydrolase family protein [Tetrasphaera australiensis]HRW41570.1 SGNH/GDSL hydrolase family protein [Microthrixaceae bacterium]
MTSRAQYAGLTALLVATLVLVAFALRTPAAPTGSGSSVARPTPTSASPSPSVSEASPSEPVAIGEGAKVAFVGDSFAAGAGASGEQARWTTVLSAAHKWSEDNLGRAGTGYLRAGRTENCTPQNCPAYPGLVGQIVADRPALVVITGGGNDLGQDLTQLGAAVTQTVKGIKDGVPGVRVVVTNPWWDMRPYDQRLATYTQAIQKAATDAGAVWVDTAQPVMGKPDLMTADGMQPNDRGHEAIATSVGRGLEQAGLIAKAAQ